MYRKIKLVLLFVLLLSVFAVGHKAMAQDNNITIKNYQVKVTTPDRARLLNIPNSKTEIYYYRKSDGKKVTVDNVITNKKGEINNVKVNVPSDVNRLYFVHELKDSKGNGITDENNRIIKMISSKKIDGNNTIDTIEKRIFGNRNNNNANYSYLYAWNVLNEVIDDYKDATTFTSKELQRKTGKYVRPFDEKPIKIKYNESDKVGGMFTTSAINRGDIKNGEQYIKFNLPFLENASDFNTFANRIRVYVAHEYGHWTMFQSIGREGMTRYGYRTHISYNEVPQVSYKEGYALFQANRFPYRFNMNGNLDVLVQGSRRDMLYGKSTNSTVMHVLRDIYDLDNRIEKRDDIYNISDDVLGKEGYTETQREQLSSGLMYITMRDSKATTLEEYITYLKKYYVNDVKEFNKILNLNGINEKGQFTRDEQGNVINQ